MNKFFFYFWLQFGGLLVHSYNDDFYKYFPEYQNRRHKVRHASLRKLESLYYNTAPDESMFCIGRPNAAGAEHCPVDKCRTNSQCQSWNDRHCVCDKELCGAVCLPLNFRCDPLDHLANGNIKMDPTNTISARAIYKCNLGYKLEGPSVRICQANGQWSGQTPTCEVQDKCGRPPSRKNARHTGLRDSYDSGSTVDYECEDGFVNPVGLANQFTALCVGKGKWRVPQFECTDRSCGHPGPLDNGRRFGGFFVYGKKVSYFCNDGYKLQCQEPGTKCDVRECQADGKWSGSRPTCESIRCPKLRAPEHGTVSSTWFTVNSLVNFRCNKGYQLFGSRSRRCQADGVWDGTIARCKVQDCGRPPNIPLGSVQFQSTKYGAVAAYTCDPYTKTVAENGGDMICQASGRWEPQPPRCLKDCKVATIPFGTTHIGHLNGTKATGFIGSDTVVFVKCKSGYVKTPNSEPKCYNGTWQDIPKCGPAPCEDRPKVINYGLARFYKTENGALARYYCYTGYTMANGAKFTEVQCHYGKWAGVVPKCVEKTCPWIKTSEILEKWLVGGGSKMKNQWLQKLTKPVHGNVVYFSCKRESKSRLVGYAYSVCLDGKWSPPVPPRCEPLRRKKLPRRWIFNRRG